MLGARLIGILSLFDFCRDFGAGYGGGSDLLELLAPTNLMNKANQKFCRDLVLSGIMEVTRNYPDPVLHLLADRAGSTEDRLQR
jgi:hypothetical protein